MINVHFKIKFGILEIWREEPEIKEIMELQLLLKMTWRFTNYEEFGGLGDEEIMKDVGLDHNVLLN